IAEWDYGRAEGRTRQQVSEASGFSWDVWRDGPRSLTPTLEGGWVDTLPDGEQVNVHSGAGETLDEVAARART
ncbi:histidine phosphatase family protein, partial [Escherichia coli]|nr:histidine phosphatase family protein [Escherichia coli]